MQPTEETADADKQAGRYRNWLVRCALLDRPAGAQWDDWGKWARAYTHTTAWARRMDAGKAVGTLSRVALGGTFGAWAGLAGVTMRRMWEQPLQVLSAWSASLLKGMPLPERTPMPSECLRPQALPEGYAAREECLANQLLVEAVALGKQSKDADTDIGSIWMWAREHAYREWIAQHTVREALMSLLATGSLHPALPLMEAPWHAFTLRLRESAALRAVTYVALGMNHGTSKWDYLEKASTVMSLPNMAELKCMRGRKPVMVTVSSIGEDRSMPAVMLAHSADLMCVADLDERQRLAEALYREWNLQPVGGMVSVRTMHGGGRVVGAGLDAVSVPRREPKPREWGEAA